MISSDMAYFEKSFEKDFLFKNKQKSSSVE